MSNKQPEHQPINLDPTHLQALRGHLQGSALTPGDEEYDNASLTWDATTFKQRPAIIVLPATVTDVQAAVSFAREHDLPA
jgi:FAD/FMN-containing dehydrogenase